MPVNNRTDEIFNKVTANTDLTTGGGRVTHQQTVSVDTTLDATYESIICDNSTLITLTLPSSASGRTFHIKKNGSGNVTILPSSPQTIDGLASYTISDTGASVTVRGSAGHWAIYAKGGTGSGGGGSGIVAEDIVFRQEVPSGLVDGSNPVFTMSSTPLSANSTLVFKGSVSSHTFAVVPKADYTLNLLTKQITFGTAPAAGQEIYAYYAEQSPGTYYQEVPTGLVNGSNKDFVLSSDPYSLDALCFFVDGKIQPDSAYSYNAATKTVTLNTAPSIGQTVYAWYSFIGSGEYLHEVPEGLVNSSNTVFYTTAMPDLATHLLVWLDGMLLKNTMYTASLLNSKITFTTAPTTGSVVYVSAVFSVNAALVAQNAARRFVMLG